MPIIYMDWITREYVLEHPDMIFVFGDNLKRVGMGGQAKAMRYTSNAIGIVTKRAPGWEEADFFSDLTEEKISVSNDLRKIEQELRFKKTVVCPSAGIGTDRAQLKKRAPDTFSIIRRFFIFHAGHAPWT
jgi:hypothetical protein